MATSGSASPDAAGTAEAPVLTDNPAESRFELRLGGELAGSVSYRIRGQLIKLVHPEVDPAFQGAGLAGHLARASLDNARTRGLAVLPTCPYIRSWIKKHPEYTDLVPPERRAEFGL